MLNPLPRGLEINLYSDYCVVLIPGVSPQVVLINAVRDVAKALAELISATKCAAGKPADDPSMYHLKSAAKVKAQTNGCFVWFSCLQFIIQLVLSH